MIAGASHASLSALSSFRQTGIQLLFLDFVEIKMIDIVRVLSRIAEEGVENDDNDELGQGVDLNHSSCTMHVSGVIDEKG